MTLVINYDRCIKTGECYRVYPELFTTRGDGFPDVLNAEPDGEEYEAVSYTHLTLPTKA